MLRLKAFSIVLHLAGWALFLMIPFLFLDMGMGGNKWALLYSLPFLKFATCFISLFYLNSNILIPEFFIPKRYTTYFLGVLVLLVGVIYLKPFDQLMKIRNRQFSAVEMYHMPPPGETGPDFPMHTPPPAGDPLHYRFGPPPGFNPGPGRRHFDVNSVLIFVLIMAFSMSVQSIEQWQITEKRAIEAESDKAIAELSFLKAQINPHFLYNTLNNIYTLSIIGSDKTSDSIMKLSNIMRYVTDEAEADFVPLSNELVCISNFIDLQYLRLGKMVSLDYSVTGNPEGHIISPLLLMTFIENVFKYGLSNHVPANIVISIDVEPDKIIFRSQNTVFDRKPHPERVGIGIDNTKKRLQYLYPNKHQLEIVNSDGLFTVHLMLFS